MSMQSEGKGAQGRNYDQATKDGTGSIGAVGAGGTGGAGDTRAMPGQGPIAAGASAGNQQRGRTDDLLSGGSDSDRDEGFIGEEAGELQTGMAGIGSLSTGNAGSRQSAGDARPDEDALGGQKQK
jgi:hypothetical protein